MALAEIPHLETPVSEPSRLDSTVDIVRDRVLVERCQAGDGSAFEDLYSRYRQRLFHFCLRRLHEPSEAEDAVQEAFTRAWRALPGLTGERRFYPWLTVIAGNICTDILRKRSRTTPVDELPHQGVDVDCPEVDERLVHQVDAALVTQAFGQLTDRHQRVLQLREGSGWSTRQIAEHEGLAVPTVESLLWRARQALRREFLTLTEGGGKFGAALGIAVLAIRRFTFRVSSRAAGLVQWFRLTSPRGPGAIISSVVVAAGVAGGAALMTTGNASPAPPRPAVTTPGSVTPTGSGATSNATVTPATATAAPPGVPSSGSGSSTGADPGANGGGGAPGGSAPSPQTGPLSGGTGATTPPTPPGALPAAGAASHATTVLGSTLGAAAAATTPTVTAAKTVATSVTNTVGTVAKTIVTILNPSPAPSTPTPPATSSSTGALPLP